MLFSTPNVVAQNNKKIHLKVKDQSLGDVIPLLTPNCSFNSETLGSISISIDRSFSSVEEALNFILSNTNISFSKISGVYVFYYNDTKREFNYSGYIFDKENNLPLENTIIKADNITFYTNKEGYFTFKTQSKQTYVEVKYLGYKTYSSIIKNGKNIKILLIPKELILDEVDISFNIDDIKPDIPIMKLDININENIQKTPLLKTIKPRENKSNLEKIYCNNVANSNIYIDNIRIFAPSPISNLIGVVNPLIVNKSHLHISDFNVKYGDITDNLRINNNDISNIKTNSLKGYINNLNLGIYTSSEISNLARFTIGYRSTYYNILNNSFTSPFNSKKGINYPVNNEDNRYYSINPTYDFDDLNINVFGNIDKKEKLSYLLSIYRSNSSLKYDITNSESDSTYNNSLSSSQTSYRFKINWDWNKNSSTNFTTEISSLDNKESFLFDNTKEIKNIDGEPVATNESNQTFDKISNNHNIENTSFALNHKINKGIHSINIGIECKSINNKHSSYEENRDINSLFVSDNIKFKKTNLNIGNRLDYYNDEIFFQPRINIKHKLTNNILLINSIGIYNKYFSKSPTKPNDFGYINAWNLKNIQKNIQFSIGGEYHIDRYNLNFSTFWHKINNFSYIYRNSILKDSGNKYGIYLSGNIDINRGVLKTYFSYSNLKLKEELEEYQLLNIYKYKNIAFSINTIYTSGYNFSFRNKNIFANSSNFINNTPINLEYFRIDLGLNYKKRFKGITINSSISLINLINTNNPAVQQINIINNKLQQNIGYSYSLQRGIVFTIGFSL